MHADPNDTHRLRVRADQLAEINRDLSALVQRAEARTGDSTRAVIALTRLLEARDGADALRGLDEILINVLGTEDFVVLVRGDAGAGSEIVGGCGPIFDTACGDDGPCDVLLSVPLRLDTRIVGSILIGSLLPHKLVLSPADRVLLGLLADHAATLIESAVNRAAWTCITARRA